MNAVNAVQLFILVWTFSAVCQADDDFSVSCEGVSGSVGKEVTLTCSVSLQYTECCITMYKFQYTESDDDSICKGEPPVNSCEQRNSFTCRYTPTTAMTEQFTFFLQTECGEKTTEFTVNMTGPTTHEIVTGAADEKEEGVTQKLSGTSLPDTAAEVSVITAGVGCFILIILSIIMTIIHKKPNFTKYCGFQKRPFLCIKHDEDNSDHPEDVV